MRRAICLLATALFGACATGEPADPSGVDPALSPPPNACRGRSCTRAAQCAPGTSTRLTGRVTDPLGMNGLYNVAVYVPNFDPNPIPHGARCDACAARSFDAATSALTDARGEFVLDDVPVGYGVPLVVEIGRFRRIAFVDTFACEERRVDDAAVRLPRHSQEGELPRIAVTTGAADALECLLRNIGIDDREFVRAGEEGSVHLFVGKGGGKLGAVTPSASDLWNDAATLSRYDAVVLSCEGGEANETKGGDEPGARGALSAYLDEGGHVFATHFHSTWLKSSPNAKLRDIASWSATPDDVPEYAVDTSFPKGNAFADWLVNVGASTTRGTVRLDNVTFSAGTIREPPAQAWLRRGSEARYFSFSTPVDEPAEKQCGRFVFSDVHAFGLGGSDFPTGCPQRGALTPQQLALEFLLFDLFSCVDDDRKEPTAPR